MSKRWLLGVSAVAHVAVGVAVFLSGAWRLERLDAGPLHRTDLVMLPPPAPQGGPVAPPEMPKFTVKPPKIVVKELIQPPPPTTEVPNIAVTGDDHTGAGKGSGDKTSTSDCTENCEPVHADPVCGNGATEAGEQCDDGNMLNGDGCSSTCRTEIPPPRPKQAFVTTSVLQALRVAGDLSPRPSTGTQQMMMRDGATRVSGVVKLCVGSDGNVASVATLASTRYPDYDQAILAAVRTWRYQPYTVDGKPVPVCSSVTFIYTIR